MSLYSIQVIEVPEAKVLFPYVDQPDDGSKGGVNDKKYKVTLEWDTDNPQDKNAILSLTESIREFAYTNRLNEDESIRYMLKRVQVGEKGEKTDTSKVWMTIKSKDQPLVRDAKLNEINPPIVDRNDKVICHIKLYVSKIYMSRDVRVYGELVGIQILKKKAVDLIFKVREGYDSTIENTEQSNIIQNDIPY